MVKSRLIIVLVTALMLAACSGGAQATPSPVDSPQPTDNAPVVEPTGAPPSDTAVPPTAAPTGVTRTFVIVPEESEARFVINEILNGQTNNVVGATNAVSGEITADYANPSAVSMGTIQVDMSTLATDNRFRNGSIHDLILQTGNPDFRYAQFTAREFRGLPESITIGQPFSFEIVGDMTIHGVTRELVFSATVTPVSETRLEGTASVTVLYADFGIQILRLPIQVASVEDDVILEIDFVAEAQ